MRTLIIGLFLLVAPVIQAQDTNRGIKLFESGSLPAAKAELNKAVQHNDNDARAHYYLGRLALLDDDADNAAEHLKRAVKLDDKVSAYHLWYGKAISQQAIHASMLERALYVGRVKPELEHAVELDARNMDARDALLDFYSMAPAAMGGGMDKAREQADAITKLNAMRGHAALGRIAMRAKEAVTVERELNAAIAIAPDSVRLYSTLASWYTSEKQWKEAFATMDRYLSRKPQDVQARYQIGRIAAASGLELKRGEDGLRAFITRPPKDAGAATMSLAYLRLGTVLQLQGRKLEAVAALKRAVVINSRNEEAKKALEALS